MRIGLVLAGAVLVALLTVPLSAATTTDLGSGSSLSIRVLSNRADLISGGDALVQVVMPAGSTATVDVGGRDVTSAFGWRPDGRYLGVVDGLAVGKNLLTARVGSAKSQITITNHPIGGPIFAGPQVQPWVCNTQNPPANSGGSPTVVPVGLGPPTDAQCDTAPAISYVYKDATTGQFTAYDPANPPASSMIATTTTDQGHTVPYIVRQEFGVEDRGIYAIAMLSAPGGWNNKLLTYFGASTAADHLQSQPSAVLDDMALSRGFMTANSSMNVNGENTNQVVSAEALMMLKEHIVETYGPIRYTIGQGCSGGSYQYMVAAMYPGLLNGIQPNCSFTDIWTTAPDVFDCGLLIHYFENNPSEPWVPAIDGHRDPSDCAMWDALFYGAGNPATAGNCKLPDGTVYDPVLRPTAVRCDIQDYEEAIWGQRPSSEWTAVEKSIGHGFANRPWGNEGVQYGLKALQQGLITPAEFADINAEDRRPDDRPPASAGALGRRRQHRRDRLPHGPGHGRSPARERSDHRPAGLQRDRRDPHVLLQLQDARSPRPGQWWSRQPADLDVPGERAGPRRHAAAEPGGEVVPADGPLAVEHRGRPQRQDGCPEGPRRQAERGPRCLLRRSGRPRVRAAAHRATYRDHGHV